MNSLVSIIIPTYNRAHLISETLDSVIKQTFENWECIIVDDSSTDNTMEIVEAYCKNDSRFKYHSRPKNRTKGANACRNYGFELSKGDFIQWFDSDDLMYNNLLQAKLNKLQEHKELNFCLSRMESFKVVNGKNVIINKTRIVFKNLFEDYVAGKITIGTPTVFWRRKILLEQDMLFDEILTQSQDLEFNSRLFDIYKNGYVIDEPLIKFRRTDDSISGNFINDKNSHLESFLEVRKRISNLAPNNLSVNDSIVKAGLSMLRSCLASRNYNCCEKVMRFILENNKNKSLKYLFNLYKIKWAYFVFKAVGSGDTRFKKYLKL